MIAVVRRDTGHPIAEARSPAGMGSYIYDCPDIMRCSTGPTFEGFLPVEATITVTYLGRTTSTAVAPQYAESSPNGERCRLGCTTGSVTVPLP